MEELGFEKTVIYFDFYHRYKGRCFNCGKDFISKLKSAKYCSYKCKKAMEKRKASTKAREQSETYNKCIICTKSVKQDSWGKIKRYCSNACKQKSYRQRKANADNLSTTLK